MTPEELATCYRTNTNMIRTGVLISFVATALYLPFTAVISTQLRRMEGSTPILAYTNFAGGMGIIVALLPTMSLLIIAAFRPERAPEITPNTEQSFLPVSRRSPTRSTCTTTWRQGCTCCTY